MQIKVWKPKFAKVRSLEHLKNQQARDICEKVCEPEVVEPVFPIAPILPELWQPWMAKQIMYHEVTEFNISMDYLEAMERRDKITEALIVLRSEAVALKMHDSLAKISDAGAAILDELWSQGDLGD